MPELTDCVNSPLTTQPTGSAMIKATMVCVLVAFSNSKTGTNTNAILITTASCNLVRVVSLERYFFIVVNNLYRIFAGDDKVLGETNQNGAQLWQ